jgi:hypothetical protein
VDVVQGLGAAIETKPVWESALVAIVAGVGVTTLFALGVLGMTRYSELRRQQRPALSNVFGAIGVVALAIAAASVVYGLVVVA